MKEENAPLAFLQEQYILDALADVRKLVFYKLSASHRDSAEDIIQRVFCKLWAWKTRHNKILEFEDWQKITRKAVYSEIAEYFTEKYSRDIVFSQAHSDLRETLFTLSSSHLSLEGNSQIEVNSLLFSIWKAARILSLRQRYVFFLQSEDFLFEFINSGSHIVKEFSAFFDLTEKEIATVLRLVPLTDKQLGELLAAKLGETISLQQIWEAKTKARVKLFKAIKEF